MTSREMVQDSATRNQRTLADAVVATNRFRELDARFKSHDGMDLDPSTPEIESGYEFNRRSIEDDRAADDRNSICCPLMSGQLTAAPEERYISQTRQSLSLIRKLIHLKLKSPLSSKAFQLKRSMSVR